MPTGRPDYWYGTALYFEETPTDGETARGPTSNWAYDHKENASIHHAKYLDAEAVSAMGAKGDANALNHDRYTDGEVDTIVGVHTGVASAHHAKYLDAEAVSAMGAKGDANALNHDRYSEKDLNILELGQNNSGDRQCYLRMHAGDAADDKFYILRDAGGAGEVAWQDKGTGDNVFTLNNVERFRIKSAGGVGAIWDDTPTNGETDKGVTSDWAYDHVNDPDAHHALGDLWVDDGNTASFDRTLANWTRDDTWRDWDISALVGSKKCLVLIRCYLQNDTAGQYFAFRTNGFANDGNAAWFYQQPANVANNVDLWVETDASGVIEYRASNGGTWAAISVLVRGRFEVVT